MNKGTAGNLAWRRYGLAVLLAFLLNFVWEAWHASYLYSGFTAGPRWYVTTHADFVQMITYAATVDAAILLIIFLAGAQLGRGRAWFWPLTWRGAAYVAGVAMTWAMLIEYKAVWWRGEWSYSALMPTVAGVGVSPLVQLAVTGILALAVTGWVLGDSLVSTADG